MYYTTEYESPVGTLTLASDGKSLCGLWLDGQKYHGGTMRDELVPQEDDLAIFDSARSWLDAYFAGKRPTPDALDLAFVGTDFQRLVWEILTEIPYGTTTTYGEIAEEVRKRRGNKTSALAVGGAVGHNPISIIVPCHRVVGADGSLTGYAGGLARKTWLLEHEGVDMGKLYAPTKGTAL
ncbi:MAG: methylated-DNA--[protein]-cysteine S-methyltransferase [Coriobacteriales bacterium]|jgi:methylated-DNA-[protein]-cysteine S-methyltransferase